MEEEKDKQQEQQGAGIVWFTSKAHGSFEVGWVPKPADADNDWDEKHILRLYFYSCNTSVVRVPKNVYAAYMRVITYFAMVQNPICIGSEGIEKDQAAFIKQLTDFIDLPAAAPV
jgi:hypothetical protein